MKIILKYSLAGKTNQRKYSIYLSLSLPLTSIILRIASIYLEIEAILLDTTEQSALGWTKYPDGVSSSRTPGWAEESFTNFERGINWRSFVVCDVQYNSVNNWLWTPYIERGDANRLYIEIKFTMRDCNLFPHRVLSCKETFSLLYKEMDSPIGYTELESNSMSAGSQNLIQSASNLTFAQADSFTLIDTIAADEGRFTSNNDVVINTEVRSVPVTKRGVYFAFRDQGACLSLISMKVYHISCPSLHTNFAHFNSTPTGKDLTSLVSVEGQCVANSLQIEQPKMFCTSDGRWNSMSSGLCKCLAGFEPSQNNTKCQACSPGKFKPSLGDSSCQTCPERSYAPFGGASECKCVEGYYRASKDLKSAPCTQPPSGPVNLSAIYVDSSSVILQWQLPKYLGNRDDLTFKLVCDSCDNQAQQATQQQQLQQPSNLIVSSPQYLANFSETKCVLSGLAPATSYRFLVYAMNGVSSQSQMAPQYSEISVQTSRATGQTSANTLMAFNAIQMLPIFNFKALPGARGTDMILSWDVSSLLQQQQLQQQPQTNSDTNTQQQLNSDPFSLDPYSPFNSQYPSLYEIRFVPRRFHQSQAGETSGFGGAANLARRSPYPPGASMLTLGSPSSLQQPFGPSSELGGFSLNPMQPQTITSTNRAVALTSLMPATEYAFQIRAKWMHTNQWTELSEPIYASTSNQIPAGFAFNQDPSLAPASSAAGYELPMNLATINQSNHPFGSIPSSTYTTVPTNSSQTSSWLSWLASSLMALLVLLAGLVLISMALVRYRKSQSCLQSLGTGFGSFMGAGSSSSNGGYAGVYGGMGVGGFESALIGAGSLHHHGQHQHHAHTLSSGSAGGLITGSNTTSRSSSSGAGNVVHNLIAATLNQFSSVSGNGNRKHLSQPTYHGASNTMAANGKLFASSAINGSGNETQVSGNGNSIGAPFGGQPQQQQQQQRNNHYHQTTTTLNLHSASSNPFQQHPNHTILLASNANHGLFQAVPSQQPQHQPLRLNQMHHSSIYVDHHSHQNDILYGNAASAQDQAHGRAALSHANGKSKSSGQFCFL